MILAIVVSNLMYLVGAVVAMVLLSTVVVVRHRRPKSIEANMRTFNRGLQALAPDASPSERTTVAQSQWVQPRPRSVNTVNPSAVRRMDGDGGGSEAGSG